MAKGSTTAEVVTRDDASLARGDANIVAFLQAAKADADRDPLEVQLDMVRKILAADNVGDVFTTHNAEHLRDYIGTAVTVTGVKWNESTQGGEGLSFYAVLEAVNNDGEPLAITTGAVQIMAQMFACQRLNAFPVTIIPRESERPTAQGFRPMWCELVEPEKPF